MAAPFCSRSHATLLLLLAARYADGVPVTSWATSARSATASSDGPDCPGGSQFPNIEFLGRGYDVVKGNPEPWASGPGASGLSFDPGWGSANVIDMEDYSAGGEYSGCKVPNAVIDSVLKTESCVYHSTFTELGDAASYQNSLRVDAGISAHGGWGPFSGSFSASGDYSSLNSGTSSHQSIYLGNSAICQMYTASFNPFSTLNLTSGFRKAVAALPTNSSYGDDVLIKFVGYYGTHYTDSVKMGAKASLIYRLDMASYSQFQSSSWDIQAAMSASFGCFGGAAGHINVNKSDESYQAFNSLTKDTIISCVGAKGQCPLIDDTTAPNDWATLARESPTPIQYTLTSIADLLTSEYFDVSVEPQIASKQNRLYHFLADEYCTKMPQGQQKLCNPPARDGYWISVADVSTGQGDFCLAALDGISKLYAAGDGTARVEVFDPSANKWQSAPSMSTARYGLGLAALDGKLYAAGGNDGSSSLSTVEVFDPRTNSWQSAPSMSTARVYLGLAALDAKLYAAGGAAGGVSPLSTVEVFDPSANKWQSAPSMSTARWYLGLAALDGKLYAAGGNDGISPLSTVEVFDPSTNNWQRAPSMSTARYSLGLAALDGKLYAAGGNDGISPLSTVEMFDPRTNNWQSAPSMSTARVYLGLAALDGKLHAAGSIDEYSVVTVERFWNASAAAVAPGMTPELAAHHCPTC
jgi:N-acetylneuraminic acid mutarotase